MADPTAKIEQILLLVWVHGFKGNQATFAQFPDDACAAAEERFRGYDVRSIIYPKYRTVGEIEIATETFVKWLYSHVEELERDKVDSSSKGVHTTIILLGHSMGGMLVADAAKLVHDERKKKPDKDMAEVRGVIGIDTPFIGIHPALVSYGMEQLDARIDKALLDTAAFFENSPKFLRNGMAKIGISTQKLQSPPGSPGSTSSKPEGRITKGFTSVLALPGAVSSSEWDWLSEERGGGWKGVKRVLSGGEAVIDGPISEELERERKEKREKKLQEKEEKRVKKEAEKEEKRIKKETEKEEERVRKEKERLEKEEQKNKEREEKEEQKRKEREEKEREKERKAREKEEKAEEKRKEKEKEEREKTDGVGSPDEKTEEKFEGDGTKMQEPNEEGNVATPSEHKSPASDSSRPCARISQSPISTFTETPITQATSVPPPLPSRPASTRSPAVPALPPRLPRAQSDTSESTVEPTGLAPTGDSLARAADGSAISSADHSVPEDHPPSGVAPPSAPTSSEQTSNAHLAASHPSTDTDTDSDPDRPTTPVPSMAKLPHPSDPNAASTTAAAKKEQQRKNWQWVRAHMEFMSSCWNVGDIARRMKGIDAIQRDGVYFVNIYTIVPPDPPAHPKERTFVSLPTIHHPTKGSWKSFVHESASDQVEAHMSLFDKEKHTGYGRLIRVIGDEIEEVLKRVEADGG